MVCGHHDRRQAGAAGECAVADVGDAVGKRNSRHAGAAVERIGAEAGDRQAAQRLRDGHVAAGPEVAGDGNGAGVGHAGVELNRRQPPKQAAPARGRGQVINGRAGVT